MGGGLMDMYLPKKGVVIEKDSNINNNWKVNSSNITINSSIVNNTNANTNSKISQHSKQ
jgi:hypothetical protein